MANETVYRVMNHAEVVTLKEMVMKNGKLTYEKLCRYLCPVMKDLSKIHEKGIIHGAICPDKTCINRKKLKKKTATMYYLLSGKDLPTPMDRLDSEKEKTVQNVINSLEIPEKTKEGMRKGLAVLKKDRIGTMRELLEYCSEEPVPIAASPSKRRRKWPIFLLGALVIAGGAYAAKVGFHLTKSAEQYYEEGNYEEALAAYREAGDTENVERVLRAAYDRAEDYSHGSNGYERDEEVAIRYYKLVAENDGDIDEAFVNTSFYNLGWIMAYNETKEDDTEAAFWLEKAASKGDAAAAFILGDMYADGKLGERDYNKAIKLYRQSANGGDTLAMQRLGEIYEKGWFHAGIDLEEALKWYQMAADQDYDGAQESVDRVEEALQNAAENS